MSKDCLQTVYKKEVDNNNLPIFGTIIGKVPSTSGNIANMMYIAGEGCKVSLANGSLYAANSALLSQPYEVPSGSRRQLKYSCTGETKLFIGDKYKLTELSASPFIVNLEDLEYCESLTYLSGKIEGDLSHTSRMVNMQDFTAAGTIANKAEVYGDIINLVNCAFDANNASLTVSYSHAEGDWLNFIRTRHAKNKSLGMKISSAYSNVKFNGKDLGVANGYITYVSDNKMAIINTGNNNGFTIGYTDEEIATNTATGGVWAGKSIRKCD